MRAAQSKSMLLPSQMSPGRARKERIMVKQQIGLARITTGGAELEFESRGEGEPVLLVHGAIAGDAFAPLLAQPALTDRYRLVNYHRRGYLGSSRAEAPFSIAQQAKDAVAVLDGLGIEKAHVAGHSLGGIIGLQLTLDAPERVASLALLEPGTILSDYPEEAMKLLQPTFELYEAGEVAAALDAFGLVVVGQDFRQAFEGVMPAGWFDQAIADAATFFEVEIPAMLEWRFTAEQAARIDQPVLSVLGADSATVDPFAVEEHSRLQAWMPQTEAFVLAGATHGLQMMQPAGMAAGLADFLARHPIGVPIAR
jgi:3-oxoadipate enol-lactonase